MKRVKHKFTVRFAIPKMKLGVGDQIALDTTYLPCKLQHKDYHSDCMGCVSRSELKQFGVATIDLYGDWQTPIDDPLVCVFLVGTFFPRCKGYAFTVGWDS